jgi:hypothetical protein
MAIYTKLFASSHDANLPLIAARHVLDALAQPNTPDGLRRAATLAGAAADKTAELCAKVGRVDLRAQFAEQSKVVHVLCDGAHVFAGEATTDALRLILVGVAVVLRACVNDRFEIYLPDGALKATASTKAVEAILAESAKLTDSEFYPFNPTRKLPPRADNTADAFAADLRKFAVWLRNPKNLNMFDSDTAWTLVEFRETYDESGRLDELRPISIMGLAWRGFTVPVTRAELDAAGYQNLAACLAKHTKWWPSASLYEHKFPVVLDASRYDPRNELASAYSCIPAMADFSEALAAVLGASCLLS